MQMPSAMRTIPWAERARFNASFVLEHYLKSRAVVEYKERTHQRIVEHVRAMGPGRCIPVDRVRNITPEQFRDRYLRKGIPVIIEGAAADWRCTREWSFESWKARFGHETIRLVDRPGLTDDDFVDEAELTEEINFGEFLDEVVRGGRRYMRFAPLFEKFPELGDDVDWDWLRSMPDQSFGLNAQLFVGGGGRQTPLHNAMTVFLFANIVGVKRWTFVPNHYLSLLDPPADSRGYNHSEAVVREADGRRFPGLESVDYMEAVMNPGDVLFNPSWNWHSVVNDSATIGIRFGMIRPATMFTESLTLAFIRFFGGRHAGVPLATTIESARDAAVAVARQLRGTAPGTGRGRR